MVSFSRVLVATDWGYADPPALCGNHNSAERSCLTGLGAQLCPL